MVKKHYLNLHTHEEGTNFFRIIPNPKKSCALLSPKTKSENLTSAQLKELKRKKP